MSKSTITVTKSSILNTYNFVSTSNRQLQLDSNQYELTIRQQPKQARLCSSKERDRRPVDPPPIIQLKVNGYSDEAQNFLQSPYYFMCANLVHPTDNSDSFTVSSRYLAGTVVSSLHKLKDIDNKDGGFFVFGDISVRVEGRYRLRFSLFEIIRDEVVHIQSVISDVFTVFSPKAFPGMSESTFLSRSFSDQGVRIRIRKEHRIQMKRPQSNNRQSDTAECDDDNEDGIMDISNKRKRTSMEMYDPYSSSTPYPHSQSPYAPPYTQQHHHQYPSRQRQGGGSLTYPPPLGYPQQYNQPQSQPQPQPPPQPQPQRQRSYYEDSEYESSSHDDHTSSSSYYYNHEQYEHKRPRLSNSEMYDYRQPSANNQYTTGNHHHYNNNVSPPPLPPYRTPRRGITLSPLLETQPIYNSSSANSSMYNHNSSLSPVRHRSFDVLTSTASPNTTSLDSTYNYPMTTTTSSTTQSPPQIIPPSESYYRPPTSSSSLSAPLFPPKTPVRSRTLPILSRSDNMNNHSNHSISNINNISNDNSHHHHSTASLTSKQLPTPQTSFDVNHNKKQLYPYPPLTPPNPNNSSVDSYKNGNDNSNSNNSNNLTPRFAQQFTLSPRPAPLQLDSKSPLSSNNNSNNHVITKTNSLPVMSSNTSSSTTFFNNAITSSPQLLPTNNNNLPRLPPITTLTNSIDFIINKKNEQEVTAQQYLRPHNSYSNDWHNSGGGVNNGNHGY